MEFSTSCFYGKKITKHVRLRSAIDLALNQKGNVDIVMSGPPQGGDGSDIEDVDEDIAEILPETYKRPWCQNRMMRMVYL